MTTQEKVLEALQKFIPARNNDMSLTKYIWKRHYKNLLIESDNGKIFIPIDNLLRLPSEARLGRIRRKIQNDKNLFKPTIKSVQKIRGKK